MNLTKIRSLILKNRLPWTLGQKVLMPTYRRVSKSHDKGSKTYEQKWVVGYEVIESIFVCKNGKKFDVGISFHRRANTITQVLHISSDTWLKGEVFSKKWAEKFCDTLNTPPCNGKKCKCKGKCKK